MGRDDGVAAGLLRVTVAFSPRAGEVEQVALTLQPESTVGQALQASGLLPRLGATEPTHLRVGVWGKLRTVSDVLRDLDRVEIYRPLQVDPKEARRQRYQRHRERFKR